MTPPARVGAAIEIVDLILAAAHGGGAAADTIIRRYFQERRYAGSKDRRAVRDLVFRAVRRAGEVPASGRAALVGLTADEPDLAAHFDGSPHAPAPIADGESGSAASFVPAWLLPRFDALVAPAEHAALLDRAPLDLRVNRLQGTREEALVLLPDAEATPHAPCGLRLPEGFRVEDTEAWRTGLVEIQDEGSQLLALACEARSGLNIVDLCAGAGGKTLALAADMAEEGHIIAADTDRARLSRLMPRAERAGATGIETRLLDPGREAAALGDLMGRADLVLVDAPCSGSGTWRRNPETRWRLTPDRLDRLVQLQARLLDVAAPLLKPGGRLVYAVCSLLAAEGREQAAAFAARSGFVSEPVPFNAGRAAGAGRLLTPDHDGTDGFFVACLSVPC